jgi:hypothetical protein
MKCTAEVLRRKVMGGAWANELLLPMYASTSSPLLASQSPCPLFHLRRDMYAIAAFSEYLVAMSAPSPAPVLSMSYRRHHVQQDATMV